MFGGKHASKPRNVPARNGTFLTVSSFRFLNPWCGEIIHFWHRHLMMLDGAFVGRLDDGDGPHADAGIVRQTPERWTGTYRERLLVLCSISHCRMTRFLTYRTTRMPSLRYGSADLSTRIILVLVA